MDDLESAIHYYRIAAMHDNAPSATASMPIVLRSQQGQHLISAQLLYDQAAVLAEREESPELIDQTILEAVYELQLHLLTTADSANDTCTQNYSCLQLALTREI
jgi:TPR repeat protein